MEKSFQCTGLIISELHLCEMIFHEPSYTHGYSFTDTCTMIPFMLHRHLYSLEFFADSFSVNRQTLTDNLWPYNLFPTDNLTLKSHTIADT
jgi:hypothetical protein